VGQRKREEAVRAGVIEEPKPPPPEMLDVTEQKNEKEGWKIAMVVEFGFLAQEWFEVLVEFR